jgi:hypothetical protein
MLQLFCILAFYLSSILWMGCPGCDTPVMTLSCNTVPFHMLLWFWDRLPQMLEVRCSVPIQSHGLEDTCSVIWTIVCLCSPRWPSNDVMHVCEYPTFLMRTLQCSGESVFQHTSWLEIALSMICIQLQANKKVARFTTMLSNLRGSAL